MELLYKPDFERARVYWNAFWEKEVLDRPLVCVQSPKRGKDRSGFTNTSSESLRIAMSGEYQSCLERLDSFMAGTFYGGEAIPNFEVTLGPDQFASFLGAKIIAPAGHQTTWVNACVDDWGDFPIELHREKGAGFERLMEYMRYAANFGQGRFLIGMLDLHGGMDALSALRGPQNLCLDLMDCPEEVETALAQVRRIYPAVFEEAYKAGDMEARGSVGWAPTYSEGRFAVLQCDFSCMMSPEQARRFVIPQLAEEAAYLDHCVYHYDGKEALGHLDDILSLEDIDVIQWVPGEGNPRSIEWMDLLHRIQRAGKGLWIYDWTLEEIRSRFRELRPEGLVFSIDTASQDDAESLLEHLTRHM